MQNGTNPHSGDRFPVSDSTNWNPIALFELFNAPGNFWHKLVFFNMIGLAYLSGRALWAGWKTGKFNFLKSPFRFERLRDVGETPPQKSATQERGEHDPAADLVLLTNVFRFRPTTLNRFFNTNPVTTLMAVESGCSLPTNMGDTDVSAGSNHRTQQILHEFLHALLR